MPKFTNHQDGPHSHVLACLLHVLWGVLRAGKDLVVQESPPGQITYPPQVSLLGISASQRLCLLTLHCPQKPRLVGPNREKQVASLPP